MEGAAASTRRTASVGASPTASTPFIAPFSRMCRVSARVSTSLTMGMRRSPSHTSSMPLERQFEASLDSSRTTTPATMARCDSRSSGLMP